MRSKVNSAGVSRSALLRGVLAPIALLLAGCGNSNVLYDFDGDGVLDDRDCAPEDPNVSPNQTSDDWGDDLDSNCDGNDGIDGDGDGFPAPGNGVPSELEDCNDSDPEIRPNAEEIPNDSIDQDCDGLDTTSQPGTPEVTVGPVNPRTGDDLVASVDWDLGVFTLIWSVDNVPRDDLESLFTVPASATSRDQFWRATARAAVGGEIREGSAAVTIGNTPPVISEVQVTPGQGGTVLTTFECDGTRNDADDDGISLGYRWYVNEALVAATTSSISSEDGFSRGDRLNCEITPDDGTDQGSPVLGTVPVTVANSPPSEPPLTIAPGSGTAGTEQDLTCTVSAASTDDDDDAIGYQLEWRETNDFAPRLTQSFVPGDTPILVLEASETTRGDEWTCRAWAEDDNDPSNVVSTAAIEIINTPPTAPVVQVDTTALVLPTQDITCSIATPSSDADGDPISYHMEWLEDGNSIPFENTNASAGDTLVLPALSYTDSGEIFSCVVTPNDNFEDGAAGSVPVQICGDTRITFQNPTDWVRIGNGSIPNYGTTGTIEAWIYLTSTGHGKVFGHWQDSAADLQWNLTPGGKFKVYVLYSMLSGGQAVQLESPPGSLPIQQWLHLAMQWGSAGISIWIDGVEKDSSTSVITPLTANNWMFLGKDDSRSGPQNGAFLGSIQQFRLSNITRYNSSGAGPAVELANDSNTVALYRLDGSEVDVASNGEDVLMSSSNLLNMEVTCLNP